MISALIDGSLLLTKCDDNGAGNITLNQIANAFVALTNVKGFSLAAMFLSDLTKAGNGLKSLLLMK